MSRRRSRSRKPGGRAPGPRKVPQLTRYIGVPNPYFGLSQEERDSIARETAERSKQLFEDSLAALDAKILDLDPIQLLGSVAFQSLLDQSGRFHSVEGQPQLIQAQVELLQGLVLRNPRNSFKNRQLLPSDFISVREYLTAILTSASFQRFNTAEDKDAQRRQFDIEDMRMHTETIRNWAYPHQIRRIVKGLFASIDDELEVKQGVRVSNLVDMFVGVTNLIEDRISKYLHSIRLIRSAPSPDSAIQRFCASFPEAGETPDSLKAITTRLKADSNSVRQLLDKAAVVGIPSIFLLSLDDFVQSYPGQVQTDDLRKIIDLWSLKFGDLADKPSEHMLLGNPVWDSPAIALGGDEYYWPVTGTMTSFCLELMERVVKLIPELFTKYVDRRGEFLETAVASLFRSALPTAKVFHGSMWTDPDDGITYENDILVLIDTFAIVVEAKAGKVTASARRGGEARLQRTIDDLVIAPSIQANRFVKHLRENPGVQQFPAKKGGYNEVDTTDVRNYISLNVVLELLGSLNARVSRLKESGFVPENLDMAPSMSLTDLENVFEILGRSSEKVHYLARRSEFEAHAEYTGDEMDLLAFYLDNGFNIGEAEFDGTVFMLFGWSERLDPYFMREYYGRNTDKPQRRYTRFWKDILRRLEDAKGLHWLRLTYTLLNAGLDNQIDFEKAFQKAQEKSKRRSSPKANLALVAIGPAQRRDAIVGIACSHVSRDEAYEWLKSGSIQGSEFAQTPDAAVLLADISRVHYPYSMIGYFFITKDDGEDATSNASQYIE